LFTRPVAVVYGDPIESDALLESGADDALAQLKSRIEQLVDEAESMR
jgi:hypothetical protein